MPIRARLFIPVLAIGLAAAGCANFSQLQDAETLPKGQQSVTIGASFTKYETDIDDDGENESVNVPAIVVGARRGLTDKLEAQATAWIPLGARAGLKYQLLGESGKVGPHLSVGGHVGYLSISASSEGSEDDASAHFLDVYVPVYVGYRVSPGFEVYGAPQYIFRSVFGDGDSATGHVTGATLGIAVGQKSKLFIEAGGFYDTLYDAPIINTAIGIGL